MIGIWKSWKRDYMKQDMENADICWSCDLTILYIVYVWKLFIKNVCESKLNIEKKRICRRDSSHSGKLFFWNWHKWERTSFPMQTHFQLLFATHLLTAHWSKPIMCWAWHQRAGLSCSCGGCGPGQSVNVFFSYNWKLPQSPQDTTWVCRGTVRSWYWAVVFPSLFSGKII